MWRSVRFGAYSAVLVWAASRGAGTWAYVAGGVSAGWALDAAFEAWLARHGLEAR